MLFEPVWVSSLEHIAAFEQIYKETNWPRRLFGAYRMPEGFPYLRMPGGLLGAQPLVPIVMFSQGQLRVENQRIEFDAKDYPAPRGATRHNLRTDWHFVIRSEEIVSIKPFPYQSPILRYYDMPFTKIRTRQSEKTLGELLICVGGTGPSMGHIRQQSGELTTALQNLKRHN